MKKHISIFILMVGFNCVGTINNKHINKKGSEFNKPWVRNLQQAFMGIPTKVKKSDYLFAWTANKIPMPRFTETFANRWGIIQGGQNHFQSIMRLPYHLNLSDYIVITGSDPHGRDKDNPKTKGSKLIVIKMGSERGKLKWNGNIKSANKNDRIVKLITFDKDLWHAGGMDIEGKYLAVPVEKGGVDEDSGEKSKIIIFDITNPEKPLKITEVVRNGVKCGVASLIRLDDGHYLLGAFSDSDKLPVRYDFYYSKTTNMKDGFEKKPHVVYAKDFQNHDIDKKYQNINFVRDYNTGEIFAIGTRNTNALAPVINGKDKAELFKITYRGKKDIKIRNTGIERHFYCKDNQCNFNAGTGLFVPDTHHLALYAVPHWLPDDGKTVHFNQYFYLKPQSLIKMEEELERHLEERNIAHEQK